MNIYDDIKKLKGIGPKKSEGYNRLGIYQVGDFLEYYPCNWEDRSHRTVRCISGFLEYGSSSDGNSSSTWVISLPRSPHPMYTTTLASLHLASWCCVTVLPVPNPPGIAATPPLEMGDERRAGMDALAAGHALYREGRVNDAMGDLVVLVGLLEVERILIRLPLAFSGIFA